MSYQLFIKDKNLVPENIKKGVTILKVTGTMEGGRTVTLQSKTVDSSTEKQTVTYDSGYDGLKDVTVNAYELDSKTVNSSTSQQIVTSSADGLSSVTVNPYTLDSKTVDSSTSQQVVTSSADGLSSVTVNPYTVEERTVTPGNMQIVTPLNADAISKVTVNPVSLRSKTINPSTASQTYVAAAEGVNGYGDVTVNAVDASIDGNIQAGNIKKDVTILGVTGTLEEGGGVNNQNKTVNSSTSNQTVTYDSGYTGLGTVTVNKYTLDSKTVDPSTSQQTVNSSADGLLSVTVNAVTSSIDGNIQAGNIKKDVSILGVVGTYEGSGGGNDWLVDALAGNITDLSGYSLPAPTHDYQYYYLFANTPITSAPDMSTWTSISGDYSCYYMFYNNASLQGTINLSNLSSISDSQSVSYMFSGTSFDTIRLDSLSNFNVYNVNFYTMLPSSITTAVIHPKVAELSAYTSQSNSNNIVNIELTDLASYNLYFEKQANLSADSVLNIIEHLSLSVSGKRVTFYSGGLTVTDYADGRIQTAYDAAVAAGWTINNLTIVQP